VPWLVVPVSAVQTEIGSLNWSQSPISSATGSQAVVTMSSEIADLVAFSSSRAPFGKRTIPGSS
jgi:hypothetical protein